MGDVVSNLEEARQWFLENSTGSLVCIKGEESKICKSYPEAVEYYEEKEN